MSEQLQKAKEHLLDGITKNSPDLSESLARAYKALCEAEYNEVSLSLSLQQPSTEQEQAEVT